jgi:hypothetical protein
MEEDLVAAAPTAAKIVDAKSADVATVAAVEAWREKNMMDGWIKDGWVMDSIQDQR